MSDYIRNHQKATGAVACEHTQGPWAVDALEEPIIIIGPETEEGTGGMEAIATMAEAASICMPDAARIVACVNGCDDAGIVDPAGLAELIAATRRIDPKCEYDTLNPCYNQRPSDVAGKHWGGGEACLPCHVRAALRAVRGEGR